MDPEVTAHSPAGAVAFREAAEEALTAAGLHVSEGGRVWAAYRRVWLRGVVVQGGGS
jgi:squamous cell carcinoma antigen recognized by T-cells 3